MLIAQITDTHLVEKNCHWLSEPATETRERLLQAVHYINELNPIPDIVILTGDATDTGSQEAYIHLKELLNHLKVPIYLIPGNHDDREQMRKAFSSSYMPKIGFLQYVIDNSSVRIICLDTLVEGKDHGLICPERFCWLEKSLREKPEKPALIFMHHPPAKTGFKLFDSMLCNVPAQFESLIRNTKHLLGIYSGHYHHLCITSYGGKACFIAPSIAPIHYLAHPNDMHVTALELEEPSVTLHFLNEDNIMTSQVTRIKQDFQRIDWKIIKNKF